MTRITVKDQTELELAMMKSGVTRTMLADLCGVHYSTIAYYISGHRCPNYVNANKIAKAIGVPFDVLFVPIPRKPRKQDDD